MVRAALEEDVSATRLIEQSIAMNRGHLSEILLKADKAAVLGRRMLQALIDAEAAAAS